jgi:hypothetical protein
VKYPKLKNNPDNMKKLMDNPQILDNDDFLRALANRLVEENKKEEKRLKNEKLVKELKEQLE